MARLFATPREIALVNDLTKELVKDVIGQKIYLYSISATKTRVHFLYDEAPDKIFEHPVEIGCLVEWKPQVTVTNQFGTETLFSLKVYIQSRDLLDRQIVVLTGDFFSYGELFFEITSVANSSNIFGQIEYTDGLEITGIQSRKSNFTAKIFGPTNEAFSDPDAVQKNFYQQRGQPYNAEGETGDVRELQKNGVLEAPLSIAEVTVAGASGSFGSSFYDEK